MHGLNNKIQSGQGKLSEYRFMTTWIFSEQEQFPSKFNARHTNFSSYSLLSILIYFLKIFFLFFFF